MSKKHFIDLAARLKSLKPSMSEDANLDDALIETAQVAQWERMVREMTRFCVSQANRFDEDRFLAACGIDD